ncbi:MAG TPA: thioredoxin domain-containing protein [Thermoanaerobaculia bacterium]|nr:thioredoxin domain-containing protein [Thermoanaerobaculia bacterium]
MRRILFLAFLTAVLAAPARADEATRQRVTRYFTEWYSVCPGTRVTVAEASEVAIPGYTAYRAERACDFKNRNELNVTLVDAAGKQIFVGQVLHDDNRKNQPFLPATDLPAIRGALAQEFGLPVAINVKGDGSGVLIPLSIRIQQVPGAVATLSGFVSHDGATILLGEFFPFDVAPADMRAKLIAESPGAPPPPAKAIFTVAAFIDFQCEKCRVRTPQVRDYAWSHGGALQTRFLPLVKIHDWSFAAAESAAALANVSPQLEDNYERAIFPKAETMNAKAARDLAADVAEAAGSRKAFEEEIASGRARDRVLADIDLALRLGLNGTPVFFFRGAWLSSEPDLAEHYVESRLSDAGAPAAKSSKH